MVGYDPTLERQLSEQSIVYAGALSGAVTRTIAQPLDVLKIRFQLQTEEISKRSRSSTYHGMLQACKHIACNEGATAFWKGLVPAQCLSVTYGIVQFYSFEVMTKRIFVFAPSSFTVGNLKPVTHFFCGSLAGILSTIAVQPFDVLRTRLVAQSNPKVYKHMAHAVSMMVRKEGFLSLYKGLIPTLIQIAPQTGFQFGFYSVFTTMWHTITGYHAEESVWASLVCGSMAGLCAKVSTYPLDLAKKRLQVQGFADGRSSLGKTPGYKNLRHCLRKIAQDEGLSGLYKGLSPSMVKAMVTVGCHFLVYEKCCQLFAMRDAR